MPKKSYLFLLTDEDRKRHEHIIEKGKVASFSVQYEILHQGKWMPVVRYDTAHGFSHKDIIKPDGTQEKILLGVADYNEALILADEDINKNWPKYRELFLRRLK